MHLEYPGNKQEAIRLLSAFPDQSEIKNIKDSNSHYLVHLAAWNGWTELVELLVTTYHCDTNCTNIWGWTSLHFACALEPSPNSEAINNSVFPRPTTNE